ncbi:MAG: hypothetical protein ACM3H8_00800 [Sphingobacteriales bacterium]
MKNKLLIYDDNCPLCSWYSAQFVKFHFLPKEGRKPFSTLEENFLHLLDFNRSRNEIPLGDTETKTVQYGIAALLEILGSKIPFIKTLGHSKRIHWFLTRLYKFISYTRKVIVAKKCGPGVIDCSPDFNYFNRSLFMSFCLMVNAALLFLFHKVILLPLPYYHLSIVQLQSAQFGLILINCLPGLSLSKQKAFEYLGQLMMLTLITNLLLIPLVIINTIIVQTELLSSIYLLFTGLLIFKEYLGRMDFAGIIQNNKWIAGFNLAGITGFVLFLFS